MTNGGGTLLRGASGGGGGAGGAGGGSSSKASANSNGASGAADGVLSVTPDSPADSEWRARGGPLDASEGGSGPWGEEDAAGACVYHRSVAHRIDASHEDDGDRRGAPGRACRVFLFFIFFNGVAVADGVLFFMLFFSRYACTAVELFCLSVASTAVNQKKKNNPVSFAQPSSPPPSLPSPSVNRSSADGPLRQVHVED